MIGMCLNLWGSVSGAKAFTKRPTPGPSQRLSAAADAVGAEVWCNPSCTTMGGSIFGLQPTRSPISAGLKLHQICCHPLPSLSAWWLPKEDALLDSHEAMNTWHGQLRCWLFYSQAALIHRVKTWHRSLGICILKHAEKWHKIWWNNPVSGVHILRPTAHGPTQTRRKWRVLTAVFTAVQIMFPAFPKLPTAVHSTRFGAGTCHIQKSSQPFRQRSVQNLSGSTCIYSGKATIAREAAKVQHHRKKAPLLVHPLTSRSVHSFYTHLFISSIRTMVADLGPRFKIQPSEYSQ